MWCRFVTATINRDGERIPLSQKTRENLEKKYDYYGASGVIDKVDKYLFNERLLLIGEDGANLITRSKPIAFIANGLYWVNNHAHVLQAPTAVFLDYLCFFINAIPLDKYVTGSAQPKMTQDKMNTILTPLPPLAEQQRIVAQIETLLGYVNTIDTDAETLDKSITLAKQKILDLAIRGKLVPQDPTDEPASELLKKIKAEKEALVKAGKLKKDKHESFIFKSDDNCYHENIDGKVTDIIEEIPFDLPEGWAWSRLYSITSFLHRGKSPKYTDEKKYPMFAQKCNQKDGIHMEKALFCLPEQYEKFPSEYKLQNCDIVINSTGTGTLGRVGIFYKRFLNNYESTVPDSHVTLVRAFENYILGEYLYACFKSPSYQQMMLDNADGSTNQKELYTKVLELFFIPLPPLAEQKRIVSQVEKLFAVLETMRG